jgi:superfamily II DNA or RNA helicase
MNNKEIGDKYEKNILNYIINEKNNNAFLWKDVSEEILIEFGFITSQNEYRITRSKNLIDENKLIDVGIDIIEITNDNKLIAVQCKFGYECICIKNLAGFYMYMANNNKINNGVVYYTSKLHYHITDNHNNPNIEYIKKEFIEDKIIEQKEFKLYYFQNDAVKASKTHFENNKRGILSMPCGSGKTLTSYHIVKESNIIVVITTLKEFARQNINKYQEYDNTLKSLLIDSDGTRDVNEIKKFIKTNKKCLLSCTYKSVDILIEIIDKLKDAFFIIDEYHNLSINNLTNEEDNIYKLLNNEENKILFLSATPRIYDLEDTEYDNFDDLTGEIFYKMDFTEAIKNNIICDYNIIIPSISSNNNDLINNIKVEIDISKIDAGIVNKLLFIFKCITFYGSRKCIFYCSDKNDCNDFKKAIKTIKEFYVLDVSVNIITSETKNEKRKQYLDEFEKTDKLAILLSVQILDECIDIPACDSIYITYNSKSKIRTIQRISRALRKTNQFKKANIYIWCNEYDEILETLSSLKEYDEDLITKIKINDSSIDRATNDVEKINKDKLKINNFVIGIKEFKCLGFVERLNLVKQYIDKEKQRPTRNDNNILFNFLSNQLHNFKNKKQFKNKEIFEKFLNDYKEYFISNEDNWILQFDELKKYIDENKQRPTKNDNKIYNFLQSQLQNFKKNEHIMENENIYKIFENFLDEYKEYFLSNEEQWILQLDNLKKYIDENKKRPTNKDNKSLYKWLSHQLEYFKNKKYIMKNLYIYNIFKNFLDDYKKYILSNEDNWILQLDELKKYIDENKKRPTEKDNKILCYWIQCQLHNFKNKKFIMENKEIYKIFEKFLDEYKEYISSNEDNWNLQFEELKKYIDENKKKPSKTDNIKLNNFLRAQLYNFKNKKDIMKEEKIYETFKKFLKDYKEYFI